MAGMKRLIYALTRKALEHYARDVFRLKQGKALVEGLATGNARGHGCQVVAPASPRNSRSSGSKTKRGTNYGTPTGEKEKHPQRLWLPGAGWNA
jgi:hypothetical protein